MGVRSRTRMVMKKTALMKVVTADPLRDFSSKLIYYQAILTCDGHNLLDDTMHEILVRDLPKGCYLTVKWFQ